MKNIIRPIASLKITAAQRKPGYLEACLKAGKVTGELIEFTRAQHRALRQAYALDRLPGSVAMIKNAAGALVRASGRCLKGKNPKCSDEEAARRLALCLACEYRRPSDGRCTLCGCFVSVKTHAAAESCPIEKWLATPIP
jgi:hypothetical protein